MNKSELIDFMAAEAGITKKDAGKALNALMKGVGKELTKGEKVTLVGFGTWCVVDKAARTGRNPKTQQKITIPAKKVVKFKPGADLKM
ncbi:HU family DNA-binding protein [Odoribacter sp. OttesenSCG-928-L07]|nr:HU family DNA-binding protein [Odoribacter sp. OttesenSCG-928-L07]MDL2240457.1 HU family DNA-binding protein [Bacteroidales bacterium OttesenSCG-928-K22]